jgi:mRNA interferase RelE/StbE
VIFNVSIDIDAITYVHSLDDKSQRIIRSHLKTLEKDPFPGKGGDKELLELRDSVKLYRLHIGHTFTAFYELEGNLVFVNEIMTTEQAHKKYKRLI